MTAEGRECGEATRTILIAIMVWRVPGRTDYYDDVAGTGPYRILFEPLTAVLKSDSQWLGCTSRRLRASLSGHRSPGRPVRDAQGASESH